MRQLVLICPLFLDFLGGGGGWGDNGTFPHPLFSQNTPKNALNKVLISIKMRQWVPIFPLFLGVGEGCELMVPSPAPFFFSQITPKKCPTQVMDKQ